MELCLGGPVLCSSLLGSRQGSEYLGEIPGFCPPGPGGWWSREQWLICVSQSSWPLLHKGDTPVPDVLQHIPLQLSPWALQTVPCLCGAPILQSFPFSPANTRPIKLPSYHGFLLTNLGSWDVGFVEKEKCFLVRECAHWAGGLKILCSAHFVFGGLMLLLWEVFWVPKSMEREELVNGLPWQMHCFQSQFKQPERRTGAGECLLEYLNVLLEIVCCW